MVKHRTKTDKIKDQYDAFKCIRDGKPVKRFGAKDGSIQTKPVVPVPDLPEKEVLVECLRWLRLHHVFHNRHDVGAGDFGYGYATYGIKGAGDIIGILSNGVHFEIECKKGKGGRLSKGQQKRLENIRKNNGIYLVVHGLSELEYYFKELI